MAGFDPFSGVLTVAFEGTRYEGGEVKMLLDVPMGAFLEYLGMDTIVAQRDWLIEHDVIQKWNFESGGKPVPVSREAIERLPLPMMRALANAYATEGMKPGIPLDESSADGDSSPTPSTAKATSSNRRRSTGRS